MEMEKCHLLFGCEIMKFFSTGLLLVIVFGSLEGSTIPHKRTVRALNATIQTHFNGTIQRRNPCTNNEVERSSYRGCHEFHHHSKESNWSDYTRKCATLISDFFHAISNLVTFKDRQSGTFDLNINTKVSHKTDGVCAETKKPICPTPTVVVESTDCEVLPSTSCDDLPTRDTHSEGSEICSLEDAVNADEQEEEKCSVDSETSVNEEPQPADSPLFPENDRILHVTYTTEKIPEPQSTQGVNPPEIKTTVSNIQITIKPETAVPSSTVPIFAPKETLHIGVSEIPQQSTGTDSASQVIPSGSKDYLLGYTSQPNEEKTDIQPSSSATQSEDDKVVPEYNGPSIEFSDKIALYNVHDPEQKSLSPSTQHYSSDTTTPSTFEIQSDYDVQDTTASTQPTSPQYQSESYDEPIQSSQAVTPAQSQPENYVNQYGQNLPTSSPPKDESTLEFSDPLAVYNVHQPRPESPSSSSLLNTPASVQPPSSLESQPENYVNYEDGIVSTPLPTSTFSPKGKEPSIEFSDQLAVYNVRQTLPPTTTQPTSSEPQPDNYDSYEDETELNEMTTPSSPSVHVEPSVEFSDQLAVYNIRTPTTTYPPSPVSQTETSSAQPSVTTQTQTANYVNYEDEAVQEQSPTIPPLENEKPSTESSDQLAVYNAREPLPGTTTSFPLVPSSIQPASDSYMNYEDGLVTQQPSVSVSSSSSPSPQPGEEQYVEYSDQPAANNVREPLPGTTTPFPVIPSSIQPSVSQSDNYVNYENDVVSNQLQSTSPSPQPGEEQYVEYSDQLAANNVREPLPATTISSPLAPSTNQPASDSYMNYEDELVTQQPSVSASPSPQPGEEQYLEYSDQLPVNNVREPLPGTTISSPLAPSTIQPASDSYMNYEDGLVSQQPSVSVSSSPSPQPGEEQYVEYSDQLAANNVREPLPITTTSPSIVSQNIPSSVVTTPSSPSSLMSFEPISIQPSSSELQSDSDEDYEGESEPTTLSTPAQEQVEPSVEYSDQLAVYNVREPLPRTTTTSPLVPSSIQPPVSQSDNYVNYENDVISNQLQPTSPSPKPGEEQYVEYSDQLSANNVREPLLGTTISSPLAPSTSQPASDSYMNYEDGLVSQQPSVSVSVSSSSSPSPQLGEEQYVEYSDQLAANNVREPLPTTTTSSPAISESVPSSVVTTLSPSSLNVEPISIQPSSSELQSDSDEDYEGESEPTTLSTPVQEQVEPSVEYSDQLAVYNVQEPLPGSTTTSPLVPSSIQPSSSQSDSYIYEDYKDQETYTSRPVTNQPQPSNEPTKEYDGEYNEQTFSNQMSPFTTPAGSVVPTTMPSSEYIDNNGPEPPSSDYPISQGIGGFVPTSLPSYSDDTSSFTTIEEPHQSQPTSTLLPTEAQQVFTDQVSDIREPQSDSSVSDGRISDMVTAVPQIDESESSNSYDDGSSLTDSQQIILSESQPETSITNEYPLTSSSNQPLPNSYDIYDEQSSTSEKETPITSANEPTTTYPQYPINSITTFQPSTKPQNFGIYDEPQGTYPPKIENESFTSYEDNVTPPAGQASVSMEPLSENDSSEIEPISSEEEPSSEEEEENGNVAVSDDQGLLPLSPHTFRPTVPIETTVNYADQTPFRPIQLPSSFGPLQENNIIYDEGIFSNETEPSAPKGEEANNLLNASSEFTKQNEGKELDSSTTLAPELEFDTYYDETFKQPSSSDSPKINNNIMDEDDVQTSSPKSDLSTTSNDYSTSLFPSTPSFTQEMITTPSTSEPMSKTYTDYEYSKTDFNSQPTFPPQTESVLYDDQSTQQPQSVDYAAYDIQSTTSPKPKDQEKIDISDQLSIYNVPESVLESSSPLSEHFSSNMVTTPQPTASSDDLEIELQPTFSPSVEPESYDEQSFTQTLPPKDLDTYVNYEDTTSSSQLPTTTTLLPNKVEPSLEYSDQLPVYNVGQPQPESPLSSSLLNTPTSVQPPSSPESQPENYVNYEDGIVSTPLPTSTSPPKGELPSEEFSDQLAIYNVRQPYIEPTSILPTSSEPQPDNYDSYEDETEPNETTTPSFPSVNVEPFITYSDEIATYNVKSPLQSSSPSPQLNENLQTITISTLPPASVYDESVSVQTASPGAEPESEEDYEDETVSNGFPTTPSSPQTEPSVEFSDELAIYNVRQPSTVSPPSSVSYVEPSSAQPSIAPQPQPDNYVTYDDERPSNQIPTTSSPQPREQQYLEYSDQLPVNNVREPLPGTTTPFPVAPSTIQPASDSYMNYEDGLVSQQPSVSVSSSPSPQLGEEQYVEYSDQLAANNVREPLPITTTSPSIVSQNIPSSVVTTLSPSSLLSVEPISIQPSSSESQSNSDEDYEGESEPTTLSTPVQEKFEPSVEYSDQLAAYNVREPLPGTTTPFPVAPSTIQPASDSYMNYEDGLVTQQPSVSVSSSPSPQPGEEQYVEYSDQLAANNVREPLSTTTTSSPAVNENTLSSFGTTLPPLFSSSRTETYDDQTVGNVPEPTFAPEMYDEPTSAPATSFSPAVTEPENSVNYETGVLPTSSSPPKSVEPFLEYSDEHSDYNVRQPEYYSSSPTPVTENLVTTTSPRLPSNDFGTNDSRVKYADSQPTFAPESDSQMYDEPSSTPASSASQPDVYTNYDDKIVSNEFPTSPYPPGGDKPSTSELPSSSIAPSPSPSTEGPFSEYSDQLSIYNIRQPEIGTTPSSLSDYVSTSPSQLVREGQVTYEDYPAPKEELLSTPSTFNLPQSQDYSVPPSNYSADQDFDYQTTAPVVSGNIPSSITTLPSPSLIDELTSPQPSLPESQSDSYEDYEDVTASTTLSTPVQVEPSVEYLDPLAAFNVPGPAIVPISASVNENAPSGDVTTSLPSSSLIVEPTSPQSLSSNTQSDSNEDYEDETVSTPSPVTAVEPSDELSMGPSELSLPSLSKNIQSGMITTFAPSLPSDKFGSYDYQPVGFESQPTFSPEVESPVYNTPTSVPSASSQPQDNYVNYEDEIESNESVTTLRPPVTAEPFVEYSDELTIYNVRPTFPPSSSPSPQLNENIAMDTVSTYKPTPVYDEPPSVSSTSPQEQQDDYVNYEDPSASNIFPITYSPTKEEPSMISSDQLPINTTSPQSFPTGGYEYDSHVEYTDSPTIVTTEPTPQTSNQQTSVRPLTSSQSQPEQYVNYEDERVSVPSPTSTYPSTQVEPSVEYSDELAAYNVREPLPGTTTPFPVAPSTIQPASDSYMNYEDGLVSQQPSVSVSVSSSSSSPSPQPGEEQYVEYSDQLAANNVREPLPITTTSPSIVSQNIPSSVVTTLSPSSLNVELISIQPSSSDSQSDSDEDYEGESEPTTLSTPVQEQVEPSVEYSDQLAAYNVRKPLPGSTTPFPLVPSSIQPSVSQSDNYVNYENDVVSNQLQSTSPSPQLGEEQYVEYSDQLAANNVREPLSTTTTSSPAVSENIPSSVVTTLSPFSLNVDPISIQPSSSELQSDSDEDYEGESEPTTLSTPVQAQVEPSVEYSDQLAVYNVQEPLPGTTTTSPLVPSSIQPSSSQSDSYIYEDYKDETVSKRPSTTLSTPVQVEPLVEYSDPLATYNDQQPEYSSPSPLTENISSDFQPTSSPQSDSQVYDELTSIPDSSSIQTDENYEDKVVPNRFSSSLSPPAQVEPSLESSDQLSAYNVNPPEYSSSSSPSPLNENYSNEIVTTTAHSLPSDGFGMYDSQVLYNDFQPTSAPQSDSQMYDKPKFVPGSSESQTDNYVNYEDKTEPNQVSSSLSPPVQVEPAVEYADELPVNNVREPIFEPTFPPVVNQNIPSSVVTTLSPSSLLSVEPISIQPSSSESQLDSGEDYEGDSEPTTLSTPVQEQVEPSVEYSDQLAVYNVRDPVFRPTSPPVVSENIVNSEATTLSPSSSLIVEQTSPQSLSDTPLDSTEDYEDETVSTLPPVTGAEPFLEVSDELSVYNVRQRPSEMSTPSPFNNNVISNLMTTISPYFSFQESSSKDSLNTISQTTVPPEYESDMYDEPQSSIQPSQSSRDDSQAFYDETTSKDFLPETLSDSDEQTISNVIQSTQSPDLSNQLHSKDEVEFQKISITTPQPESPVISESTAEQEFDYQPTLSPDYEAPGQTVTTPSSSSLPQDNYVVYEDQTVSNELTTSSPFLPETPASYSTSTPPFLHGNYTTPPSSEGLTETYTDYEGSTANSNSPSTPRNPDQVQTSTSPQPQIVNYDYYNDEAQKPEESSASPPITEIETDITLTELGPTLPPNFESELFDKSDSAQPDNYMNYEDSIVSTQIPTSAISQTNTQPPIELSDELAIYNVRKPYLEPTSIQPSSSESQPENYDTYEDQIIVSELSTPSTPQKVESTVTQPTSALEEETQIYDEPTTIRPLTPSQSQPEQYVNYEDERVSVPSPTSTYPPTQVEPSVEYSDELAAYNVREPLPGTTTPFPLVPSSIQPSVSQSDNYVNYENDVVSNQLQPTPPSPQPGEEQYVEYSDQLAANNVREPLSTTTTSPSVVGQNIPSSVVTTLSPSSLLSVEPISIQPSSSELQSDSDEDYEGESEPTTLPTPVQAQVEPSVEYSDQLALYNVRDPVFRPTSPPVVSENIVNSEATTLSPSSSLIVEQTSPQSLSDTPLDSTEDYEDETVSTLPPVTGAEPSLEASNELSIYNVRQRPSEMSTPSPFNNNVMSNFMTTISPYFTPSSNDYEDSTFQSSVTSVPEPEIYDEPRSTSSPSSKSTSNTYVNSKDAITSDDYTTPSSPLTEAQQPWSSTTPFEYPEQPTVYNVRQRPSELSSSSLLIENLSDEVVTTGAPSLSSNEFDSYDIQNDQNDELKISPEEKPKTYDDSASVQNAFPVSQPDNYMSYEDEIVINGSSTTPSSPQTEPSVEFSDELAIYNVRQPSTVSPPSSVSYVEPSSAQPSVAPQPQPDNYVTYDDERPSNQIPTTSSPQPGEEQYLEYSDQLAVNNVREPLPGTTTPFPVAPSTIQRASDSYMNYEDGLVSQQPSVSVSSSSSSSPSPQPGEEQYVEYSDQLAANNVREPLPITTTSPSIVSQNIPSSVVTTLSPSSLLSVEPISIQPSSSELQSDSDEDYEGESEPTTLSTPVQEQVEPSVEYSDQLAAYNVREPLPGTTTTSPLVPSFIQPSVSQSDNYVNYENDVVSNQLQPTSPSPQLGEEQYVEYSDQLAANNVREPLSTTTTSPSVVGQNIPSSVVTTLSPSLLSVEPISIQPSSSELQSDSDEDYEGESEPTTLSTPVQAQVEPSVEYSDQLAVYNVREPLPETTTTSPLVPSSIQPSSSQSDSYVYEDYKDETVSKRPSTTLSTPVQVEPSVEYSDPLATYNVRQPELLTSPSPLTENYANDLVTTVAPSLGPGGFETYDNQVIYADFQPTSSPQSDSQIYDEPTSIPALPESQKDEYVNYDDKMTSNVAVTSASPPVDVDVEYSDNLAIYNVRQPSTTTLPLPDRYLSEVTSGPVSYTYDGQTQSSDSPTFSPETETEYDEAPTTLEPQTPTQSFLETMITTFQPRAETQIDKTKNQTNTPSKQQQVSTFPPLHPFIPLNQPSYSLPVESQLVSEQQDQVIPNQVVNSPLVPSSELNSEQQANNFSNLVKSQETGLIDGVENTRRGTPQPEPFTLVPDQTNPSNEPGEDYVTCTCTRGNGRSTQHALMCPFNPLLKGNMTAPSYYILISKLSGGSDQKSLPDEESFQVEKVYLGDGTPLNCTDERKPFPTSKYTPVPISSARTVKLPIRLNNA